MNEQNYVADDEISLLDIYEFFRRHIVTLCVVFVVCFGSVVALEKFICRRDLVVG
jgi:hypothetical protein